MIRTESLMEFGKELAEARDGGIKFSAKLCDTLGERWGKESSKQRARHNEKEADRFSAMADAAEVIARCLRYDPDVT